MKHRSSIFAPKRLNYLTSGLNIPPKRRRFSHTRLKLLPKLWSIGKDCLFTMRVDISLKFSVYLDLNPHVTFHLIGWKQI